MNVIINSNLYLNTPKDKEEILEGISIIYVREFTEKSLEDFEKGFNKAYTSGQPIIPIIIDTFGGDVYTLLSMISTIESSQIPVATIGKGFAMSAGAILLSCGTKGYRYVDSNCQVMIHDINSWAIGKIEEIKSDVKHSEMLQNILFKKLANNSGKEDNYFLDKMHKKFHAEWYLNAKEVKKEGIVDYIGLPSLTMNINTSFKFGIIK